MVKSIASLLNQARVGTAENHLDDPRGVLISACCSRSIHSIVASHDSLSDGFGTHLCQTLCERCWDLEGDDLE